MFLANKEMVHQTIEIQLDPTDKDTSYRNSQGEKTNEISKEQVGNSRSNGQGNVKEISYGQGNKPRRK